MIYLTGWKKCYITFLSLNRITSFKFLFIIQNYPTVIVLLVGLSLPHMLMGASGRRTECKKRAKQR